MIANYVMRVYPQHKGVNPLLFDQIQKYACLDVKGCGMRTEFQTGLQDEGPGRIGGEPLSQLFGWIEDQLPQLAWTLGKWSNSAFNQDPYPHRYAIADYWGMVYNRGGGSQRHNHYPWPLSFTYYVNVPKGSSCLMLEGEEVGVSDGRLLVFPAHLYHWVEPTPVDGRTMIAGNISYNPDLSHLNIVSGPSA